MTQFTNAFHIKDNYGAQVTTGLDKYGQVHIINSGVFTPEQAQKLAIEIIALTVKACEQENELAETETQDNVES